MMVRLWPGRTNANDADAYVDCLLGSGLPAYRATPGNRGAWVLRSVKGDVAHFITLSFWESDDAIGAFAGPAVLAARYFPEDETYLLELKPKVKHGELFD